MLRGLPEGYVARPARAEDAEVLVALFNLDSQRVVGLDTHDVENQSTEWRTPGFDLERDTRVVHAPSGEPVAYAEVWDLDAPHVRLWSWGCVHPKHVGRGIGSTLLAWKDERGREALAQAPVDARVSLRHMVYGNDELPSRLLQAHGYRLIRHFSRMQIELDQPIPEPTHLAGVTVRSFEITTDFEPTVRAVRESFRDHWGYVETPLEGELAVWRHEIAEEKDFDPSLWFLAIDGDKIVAMCLCSLKAPEDADLGYVHTLGVLRSWRRRGVALALLHHAFGEFQRRGKKRVGLGVDAASLTGATRLYERAGMRPIRQSDLYEKELRPGRDLTTQGLKE